ncbi:type II secretion system protein [Vibrio mimicus]|uniref:type II secretion system protein n=1 Tax=Vibrio mimicus TaxID=674 RepID=UPI002FF27F6D
MKRQGGFTLIELVVVIVILGILAVTAAPRFLNLQNDARQASLQGLKGAIDGASGIVYGKSAVSGKDTKPTESVDGISIVYGYPAATSAGIGAAVTGLSNDWTGLSDAATTPPSFVITFKDTTLDTAAKILATNCYVKYEQATSSAAGSESKTSTESSGC